MLVDSSAERDRPSTRKRRGDALRVRQLDPAGMSQAAAKTSPPNINRRTWVYPGVLWSIVEPLYPS
jgi:hypothetical protein